MIKRKIVFELKASYYCNLRCNFCVFSEGKAEHHLLSNEQIIKIIKRISKKYPQIDFFIVSGGEPTIRKNLWEIINAARNYLRPGKIVIHTNGLILPSEKEIGKLREEKSVIFLSFHTLSPKTYLKFTNTQRLPLLIKNLKKLIKGGVTVFSNTVIMKPNQNEVEKIGDYLFRQGVKKMEFRFPFGTANRKAIFPWIIPDDFLGITFQLNNLLRKYSKEIIFFIHPSVPCLLRQKISKSKEKLLGSIFDTARMSVKNEDFISGEGVEYLFLDPRMRLVKEEFQQEAINRDELVFKRITDCFNCEFNGFCLGLPAEFMDSQN